MVMVAAGLAAAWTRVEPAVCAGVPRGCDGGSAVLPVGKDRTLWVLVDGWSALLNVFASLLLLVTSQCTVVRCAALFTCSLFVLASSPLCVRVLMLGPK